MVRREPGRDGKILCAHGQDGNDEFPSAISQKKKKKKVDRNIKFTEIGPFIDFSSSSGLTCRTVKHKIKTEWTLGYWSSNACVLSTN